MSGSRSSWRAPVLAVVLTAAFLASVSPARAAPPAVCNGQAVTIFGTDGDDDFAGTAGNDIVSLGDGNDRFDAGDGDDIVCGGNGDDRFIGGRKRMFAQSALFAQDWRILVQLDNWQHLHSLQYRQHLYDGCFFHYFFLQFQQLF